MIHPLDYSQDFLLYIAASATTITMVLVQENLHGQEHVIYYDSKNIMDSKTHYSCVEKLALATVIAVQKIHHYILLCTTIVLVDQNPMYYILTRQVLGGKYSHWIVILQEFDLEYAKATSKKSLIFAELVCDLPCASTKSEPIDSFLDEFLFLISTTDPRYGYLITYLQTQVFHPTLSHDDCHRICHHVKYYLILNDTFYKCFINSVIQRFLTH